MVLLSDGLGVRWSSFMAGVRLSGVGPWRAARLSRRRYRQTDDCAYFNAGVSCHAFTRMGVWGPPRAIHAMLTGAGAKPEATDGPFMPDRFLDP